MIGTPEPAPLEWHKDIVAVDAEGFVHLRPDPTSDLTYSATLAGWISGSQAVWERDNLRRELEWAQQNHEPSPVIAQVVEELRKLAGESDTARAQAYAHASLIFQNALNQNKP